MQGPYGEHVLDAADVCSNCHSLRAVERQDPSRSGLGGELESSLERHPTQTTVEHAPHRPPTRSKGVFCRCGVEGAHERIWADGELEVERFKTLLETTIRTLEQKGVSFDRRAMLAHALQAFKKDDASVDESLSRGLDAALAIEAVSAGDRADVDA